MVVRAHLLQWQCTCSKWNFDNNICLGSGLALSQVNKCIRRHGFVNKIQYTNRTMGGGGGMGGRC